MASAKNAETAILPPKPQKARVDLIRTGTTRCAVCSANAFRFAELASDIRRLSDKSSA